MLENFISKPPQLAFQRPSKPNPFGHSAYSNGRNYTWDPESLGPEQGATGGDTLYAKALIPQKLPDVLKLPPTESIVPINPETDSKLHEDLEKLGYEVRVKRRPDGSIEKTTFHQKREKHNPGYTTNPKTVTTLAEAGYNFSPEDLKPTTILTFPTGGGQHQFAQGAIKFFPDLGIVASNAKHFPLSKIGEAYLAHKYGSDWQGKISLILKEIQESGELAIDQPGLTHVITQLLTNLPKVDQIPVVKLQHPSMEPVIFLPPDIILDSNLRQIGIKGENEGNKAARIEDIIKAVIS